MANHESPTVENLLDEQEVLFGLGMLIRGGTPILSAFDILSLHSSRLRDTLEAARSSVYEGENLYGPIQGSDLFSPYIPALIRAGEETGELDVVMITASRLVRRVAMLGFAGDDLNEKNRQVATAVDFYILALLIDANLSPTYSLNVLSEVSLHEGNFFGLVKDYLESSGSSLVDALEHVSHDLRPEDMRSLAKDFIVDIFLMSSGSQLSPKEIASRTMREVLGIDVFPNP